MKKYRNTFGPPHLKNEWLTLGNILQGLPLGIFKYEDLPDDVKKDIEAHFKKQVDVHAVRTRPTLDSIRS